MVNEAILGALKSALARKESLKKAMMTLFNAGYKKEEISEAARLINEGTTSAQAQPIQQPNAQQPTQSATAQMLAPSSTLPPKLQPPKQLVKQIQKSPMLQQQPVVQPQVSPKQVQPSESPNIPQKVSGYGQPPTVKSKIMIILLGFLLLFLIGTLVTIFLFKEELLDLFNNLFS